MIHPQGGHKSRETKQKPLHRIYQKFKVIRTFICHHLISSYTEESNMKHDMKPLENRPFREAPSSQSTFSYGWIPAISFFSKRGIHIHKQVGWRSGSQRLFSKYVYIYIYIYYIYIYIPRKSLTLPVCLCLPLPTLRQMQADRALEPPPPPPQISLGHVCFSGKPKGTPFFAL